MLTDKLQSELKRLEIGGLVLTALGALLLLFGFFVFKTYVSSTPELTEQVGALARNMGVDMTERTHNIGLIAQQSAIISLGGYTLLAGVLMRLGSMVTRAVVEQPSIN